LQKRAGESDAKAFARLYEDDIEYRKQWRDLNDAKQLQGYLKGLASLKPTSVEVTDVNDSTEAIRLLNEMATKQGRKFEDVFVRSGQQGAGWPDLHRGPPANGVKYFGIGAAELIFKFADASGCRVREMLPGSFHPFSALQAKDEWRAIDHSPLAARHSLLPAGRLWFGTRPAEGDALGPKQHPQPVQFYTRCKSAWSLTSKTGAGILQQDQHLPCLL
jgi:hypothetical protein